MVEKDLAFESGATLSFPPSTRPPSMSMPPAVMAKSSRLLEVPAALIDRVSQTDSSPLLLTPMDSRCTHEILVT
jgi:hypothetical protein